MSDPTPFPTDPLYPDGTDPDLSKDDDARAAKGHTDPDRPDDRRPTFDEQQQDRLAAEEQGRGEHYTDIP
ncbi:hypothetical protein WDU99_15420 [Microbacterium sp. Mu-80]|uniref:Uncharacterized protein n=1 Tax=Microbacterium bandirmense TaxID=3122050 RepID=A0ABU8LFX5_9MICO